VESDYVKRARRLLVAHYKMTIHSSKAFDVIVDADGFITINAKAKDFTITLVMGEEEFSDLIEMVGEASTEARRIDDNG
jgi:hypothetical protein